MDYIFYTDNDDYLHFEFQTTDKKDDIYDFYIMMHHFTIKVEKI